MSTESGHARTPGWRRKALEQVARAPTGLGTAPEHRARGDIAGRAFGGREQGYRKSNLGNTLRPEG